jgi:hypothetical protein
VYFIYCLSYCSPLVLTSIRFVHVDPALNISSGSLSKVTAPKSSSSTLVGGGGGGGLSGLLKTNADLQKNLDILTKEKNLLQENVVNETLRSEEYRVYISVLEQALDLKVKDLGENMNYVSSWNIEFRLKFDKNKQVSRAGTVKFPF